MRESLHDRRAQGNRTDSQLDRKIAAGSALIAVGHERFIRIDERFTISHELFTALE